MNLLELMGEKYGMIFTDKDKKSTFSREWIIWRQPINAYVYESALIWQMKY
jgi:hypothetical protein